MGEFDLIKRFFTRPTPRAVLGVGDDCALLQPSAGMHMAISTDMLVSGRHFFPDVDPRALGHKALAVNLSDLAACGVKPVAFTLALALPTADAAWLEAFSQGLLALADEHGCELIGGDTTQGPLNICITVFGEVPNGQALLRSGAQAGDDVYVSGTLGDASLALAQMLQQRQAGADNKDTTPDAGADAGATSIAPVAASNGGNACTHSATAGASSASASAALLPLCVADLMQARHRLEWPTPRVALGLALRGIATAAADISDGLLGDLGHILERSGTGATLDSAATFRLLGAHHYSAQCACLLAEPAMRQTVLQHVLSGGDDYELVFTAPPSQRAAVQAAAVASHTPVSRIGQIHAAPGLRLLDAQGQPLATDFQSFDHFATKV
jgi:thiamine-monophosphate kinase